MEPEQPPKANLNVPIAIVLAGIVIAGAIYLRDSSRGTNLGNAEKNQTAQVSISIKDILTKDHILGNPKAPIVIVEYSDFECPFCKVFHNTMRQIIAEYGKDGKVAWVYRHFPLYKGNPPLHSKAGKEAEASECAAELGGPEKFWAFADKLFEVTPSNNGLDLAELPIIAGAIGLDKNAFEKCLSSEKYAAMIEEKYNEAIEAGGRGTPYNIFVLDKKISDETRSVLNASLGKYGPDVFTVDDSGKKIAISGALPFESIKGTIDTLLKGR